MGDDGSSVRVALRIRPALTREVIDGCKICTTVTPGVPQVWIGGNHAFTYDYVFDSDANQESVFQTVTSLVDGCLDGYNATILAYGQTGSGKTYTMGTGFDIEGRSSYCTISETQGIIPRAVHYLFAKIQERVKEAADAGHPSPDFKVSAQFVELYNEEIFDLIDPEAKSGSGRRPQTANTIRIHEDPSGGMYLVGVRVKAVDSAEVTMRCLRDGALSRTTASTNMNDQSSRSHAIFTLHIKQQRVISGDEPESQTEFETLSAKFHFVDLAGSERLKRTGAVGERAKEGITINMGLLALGNVISALGDTSKKVLHVPYRDSKLTRLLQDSLGGNSRTIMIACVSPCDRDFVETLNTLKYANRARNIKNRITVNQDKSSRTIALLKQEIQALQNELLEYKQGKRVGGEDTLSDTWRENLMLHAEVETLKKRIGAMQETIDMLTTKNSELLAERVVRDRLGPVESGGSSAANDLTQLIQGYMQEIEQLRAKLVESEAAYESVRKSLSPRQALSPRSMTAISENYNDLIEEAKKEVEKEKDLLQQLRNTCEVSESESDSSSTEEDTENNVDPSENPDYALATLTNDISVKTRLIEQLEASQKRMELMRMQYEEKLSCLMSRIKATEVERDKVMSSIRGEDKLKQVKEDYEKKLGALNSELKKWQSAQKEHARVLRNQTQYERQINALRGEVENMKRTKVKLMNQIKSDGMKWREIDSRRMKEINQLKKEQRKKEIAIRALEGEARKKELVLKRKHEEVNALKRIRGMSGKASGLVQVRVSPVKAKQRWARIKDHLVKNVTTKQTVATLEQEMLTLIEQRKHLKQDIEHLMKEKASGQASPADINLIVEDIENFTAKLSYVDERVSELQQTIMELTSAREEEETPDLSELVSTLNTQEVGYVFSKLYEQSVSTMTECANAATREMDLQQKLTHAERELYVARDLLQHIMLNHRDSVFLPEELVAKFQSLKSEYSYYPMSDSTESTGNGSDGHFVKPCPPLSRSEKKARRLTSTPSELLLGSGNGESSRPEAVTGPLEKTAASTSVPEDFSSFQGINTIRGSFRGRRNTYVIPPGESFANQPTVAAASSVIQTSVDTSRSTNSLNRKNAPTPSSVARLKPSNNNIATERMNSNYVTDKTVDEDRFESPSDTPPGSPNSQRRSNYADNNVFSRLTASQGIDTGGIGIIRPVRTTSNRSLLINISVAEGHSKPVLSVFATEDKLFTGSKDSTAKIWDLTTGTEIHSLVGHPNNVLCVRYLEDMGLVVTTSHCYIKLWDVRLKSKASCVKTLCSSGCMADESVKFDPGNRLNLLAPGEQVVNCVASSAQSMFTPYGERVRRWDLRKLQSVGLLPGRHGSNVTCLDMDNISFVSGSKDHSIKVYECSAGVTLGEPSTTTQFALEPPHYDGVETFAISNRVLLSGSRDTCIKRWDLDRKEMVMSLNNAHGSWITGLSFAPKNDSVFLSCGRDGMIKVWSLNECRELGKVDAHKGAVNCMTTNSSLVFTGSQDDTVKLWKVRRHPDSTADSLSDASP